MGRFPAGGSGSGSGTIETIASGTPSTLTVTDPTGPTTTLDVVGVISTIETGTPEAVTIVDPTGPTTTIDVTILNNYSQQVIETSAPGATPSINTGATGVYQSTIVNLTGIVTPITSMTANLTGTPQDGDVLRISFTSAAAQGIVWGSSFEAASALPSTTVGGVRLDVAFWWNSATGAWRCEGSTPPSPPTVVYADLGAYAAASGITSAGQVIWGATGIVTAEAQPTLGVGTWLVAVQLCVNDFSGVAVKATADLVPGVGGGGAIFTTLATSGNAVGGQAWGEVTSADSGSMISFVTAINVTVPGTLNVFIACSGTGQTATLAGQSGGDIQLSSICCFLLHY